MRAADHLPERFNSADHFIARHVREGRGDRPAIVTDDETLTYAALDDGVRRFASALLANGVHRGDRVALLLPDSPLLSVAFWGALAAGAVAVPISTMLTPGEYAKILADCDARLVLADPPIPDPAMLGAALDAVIWTREHADHAIEVSTPIAHYASTHRDGFAFILYSSGTTGEPKGVVHLHHDAFVCAETYGKSILEIRPDDRCLSVAKIFFAYGLGNSQYFPMHVGASAVLLAERPSPELVFEQLRRHRPTLFFAVPTAYANMLAAMDAGSVADFSSVRRCLSAGEALPGAIFDRWRERTHLEILDGIGSTEACHIFLSNRAYKCRPGSTGKPVTGYDLRLVDETGSDAPRGELGDLLVRGDSTMAMYWNKHEQTKRTLAGEWLKTGDKYYQDEDGYFFHGGRVDDMLKVGGIWVSPVEVEGVLASHPAVLECAVVGETDADGLVKARAFVVLRAGVEISEAEVELRAHAKGNLASYKCPRWVTVVRDLPKTATGKIQRFMLRGSA